jgi:hypothetical protein
MVGRIGREKSLEGEKGILWQYQLRNCSQNVRRNKVACSIA